MTAERDDMLAQIKDHYIRMDGKIWRFVDDTKLGDGEEYALNYELTDLPLDAELDAPLLDNRDDDEE